MQLVYLQCAMTTATRMRDAACIPSVCYDNCHVKERYSLCTLSVLSELPLTTKRLSDDQLTW